MGGRSISEHKRLHPTVAFVEMDSVMYRKHRDTLREWLKSNTGCNSVVECVSWDDSYVDLTSVDLVGYLKEHTKGKVFKPSCEPESFHLASEFACVLRRRS